MRYTASAPVATPIPTRVPVSGSSSGPNRDSRCASNARFAGFPDGQETSDSNQVGSLTAVTDVFARDVLRDLTHVNRPAAAR